MAHGPKSVSFHQVVTQTPLFTRSWIGEPSQCYHFWPMSRNFYAWNGVGLACEKLGKFKHAVDAYQHAIKEAPNSAIYYYQLGRALDGLDQRDQAIEAYRKAAELDGQHNGETIFSLGDALVKTNKLTDAAKEFGLRDPERCQMSPGLQRAGQGPVVPGKVR